jgi:hypothetical protein
MDPSRTVEVRGGLPLPPPDFAERGDATAGSLSLSVSDVNSDEFVSESDESSSSPAAGFGGIVRAGAIRSIFFHR